MERAWRHEADAASFHRRQEPVYVGLIYLHRDWVTALLVVLNCEGMNTPIQLAAQNANTVIQIFQASEFRVFRPA